MTKESKRLVVLHSDYGSERYFNYYIMENGVCLDAKWSGKFTLNDLIAVGNEGNRA